MIQNVIKDSIAKSIFANLCSHNKRIFAAQMQTCNDPWHENDNFNNFRLNDDGSYTYGYEASDGTFKLETRFADGTVQGKYGYIDANGQVKIIEYGADVMGFQPEGDLPDGIVIPPPVEGKTVNSIWYIFNTSTNNYYYFNPMCCCC